MITAKPCPLFGAKTNSMAQLALKQR